jgi:GTP-binding protein SAR1
MGWFSWFWDLLSFLNLTNKTGRILFLGLDNAGKTTLLGRLATDQIHTYRPTFNPNIEELVLGGVRVKTIDMGGHEEARRLWKEYFAKIDGVVFIVDAAARERIADAKKELDALLQAEELASTPFVVMGNKIDMPTALSEEQLKQALGLSNLTTGKTAGAQGKGVRPTEVFMCSVLRKIGYGDAIRWLAQFLQSTA